MPPPRPHRPPSTGDAPVIRTRIVESVKMLPIKPLYQQRGAYHIEEYEEHGAPWYRAINNQSGEVVRRIEHSGIHIIYRTVSAKRLRAMMREEMPGFVEEEVGGVSDIRAIQGVA